MKDSGVEWIGEIPNNWGVCHLKYLCNYKTGGTPSEKIGIDSVDNGYPWITPQDITDRIYIEKYTQYISQEAINNFRYKLFPPNSILLVCIASIGKAGIVKGNCYANQQITALIPFESRVVTKFMLFFIKVASMKISYDAMSNVVPIVNTSYLKQFYCVTPPLSDQRRIADYLDTKCAEIDKVVEKTRGTIEEYKKLKQSIITETVTKGLNSDAEMKDSGIPWIGKIPRHWELRPIRAVFNEISVKNTKGSIKTALKFTYGNIVRKNGMGGDHFDADTILNYTIVHPGTIVLNGLNLNFDFVSQRIGLVKELGIITSAYTAFIAKDFNYMFPEYATYLFKAYDNCKSLHNMGSGVRKTLNFNEFKRYYVFVPPINEQHRIADYLDTKCAALDSIIEKKEQLIEELGSYKKSLIYEYVTGKKEVQA